MLFGKCLGTLFSNSLFKMNKEFGNHQSNTNDENPVVLDVGNLLKNIMDRQGQMFKMFEERFSNTDDAMTALQNRLLMQETEIENISERGSIDPTTLSKTSSRNKKVLFGEEGLKENERGRRSSTFFPEVRDNVDGSNGKMIMASEHKIESNDKMKFLSVSSYLRLVQVYSLYQETAIHNSKKLVHFVDQAVLEQLITMKNSWGQTWHSV